MEKAKDISATDAIARIADIETEADLSAFIEGEKRPTVLAAADARYAELTEADEEPAEEPVVDAPEEPVAETDEESATEEEPQTEEQAAEDVAIVFKESGYEALVDVVNEKINQEKQRFPNGNLPKGDVTAELRDSLNLLGKAAQAAEGLVGIPVTEFGNFMLALKHQLTMDRQRRGLSQPGNVDAALESLFTSLSEETEA